MKSNRDIQRQSASRPAPDVVPADPRPVLLRQSLVELTAETQRHGFPGYRARQVYQWLYKQIAGSIEEMTNLPADYRAWLAEFYRFGGVEIADRRVSADGSQKLLIRLHDGRLIESVLMPDGERRTLCLSSQVGCPLGCRYCLTGQGGLLRNCSMDEILGQYLAARRLVPAGQIPITHLVFMGMGEPLLNTANVFAAIGRLTDPRAVGLSPRRITVSTAGVVKGIDALGEANLGVKLAVSLNASTEEQRQRLMPNRRLDRLEDILEAGRRFPLAKQRRITFAYVLLDGFNDALDDAHRLGRLLHGIRCKINLIPFNPVPGLLPFRRPPEAHVQRFQQILAEMNYTVSIRYSKGEDVGGACGQLAGHLNAQILYDARLADALVDPHAEDQS